MLKKNKFLNWKNYETIILKYKDTVKNSILFLKLIEEAKKSKDFQFVKNLTIEKLNWKIWNMKRDKKTKEKFHKKIENNSNKSNINSTLFELEINNIKKQKQNLYLKKNFREEGTISTIRDSIIESLNDKINNKTFVKVPNYKNVYKKEKFFDLTLEHVLTDIHLNEVIIRKNNMNDWGTTIWLNDICKVINKVIEKQNWQYKTVSLLLLGDLVWTTIHEWLELDIEPIRAASFMASIFAQAYFELKKHFEIVHITLVPGNHSETRLNWNKVDMFNENYDFIVGEKIKEYLSIFWEEHNVFSPSRDLPLVVKEIWTEKHWYIHWDRFWTRLKSLLPMMEKYYNVNYLDYLHEWHFHTEKIRYEEDSMKFTYPCLCQPSSYWFNRIWVVSRERQIWNIYKKWKLLETYSIDLDNNEKENKIFKIQFDIDNDLSEIFKLTFEEIKKIRSRY